MYACIHANGIAESGIANEFSPLVEEIDPSTVVMEIKGMERLLGSPQKIANVIAARAGPRANVAVASNRNAAVHAARGYEGIVVIPPGEEAARLGGLPVSVLDTSEDIRETLALWGIHTLRDLAALPIEGLSERFGAEGVRLHRLSRGQASAPLEPERDKLVFEESMELEHAIDLLEPLSFVLSRQLHQLCDRLARHGLSALELRLTLRLENRAVHDREIRLPAPMRNPILFLKLLTLELEARPPIAPIVAVSLAMQPATPRPLQEGLFLPPSPEPEKLELTLKRIAAIVGQENVGSPELIDTHRPGAFRMAAALAAETDLAITPATLAFRVFRPAVMAKVTPQDGPPEQVWSQRVQGRVLMRAGPWRTSGDWWTEHPWARDDWDLSLSDGGLYRLYREFFSGRWFLEGRYD
ncbi:MAG: hypothetical protein U0Q16_31545 [Bryobacteraceae bacterium]